MNATIQRPPCLARYMATCRLKQAGSEFPTRALALAAQKLPCRSQRGEYGDVKRCLVRTERTPSCSLRRKSHGRLNQYAITIYGDLGWTTRPQHSHQVQPTLQSLSELAWPGII